MQPYQLLTIRLVVAESHNILIECGTLVRMLFVELDDFGGIKSRH